MLVNIFIASNVIGSEHFSLKPFQILGPLKINLIVPVFEEYLCLVMV
jgi:hypothetical protein